MIRRYDTTHLVFVCDDHDGMDESFLLSTGQGAGLLVVCVRHGAFPH